MVCEMTISKAGNISSYQFMEGIIHSHARLTYNKVWTMLKPDGGEEQQAWREHYSNVLPHVENLYALYKVLRKRREARGAMDFDSVETRIIFDAERKIQQIVPVVRNEAHMLIEECMLAANVCAADFFDRSVPIFLWRMKIDECFVILPAIIRWGFHGLFILKAQSCRISVSDDSTVCGTLFTFLFCAGVASKYIFEGGASYY